MLENRSMFNQYYLHNTVDHLIGDGVCDEVCFREYSIYLSVYLHTLSRSSLLIFRFNKNQLKCPALSRLLIVTPTVYPRIVWNHDVALCNKKMSPSGYPGVSSKNSDVWPAISNMNEELLLYIEDILLINLFAEENNNFSHILIF